VEYYSYDDIDNNDNLEDEVDYGGNLPAKFIQTSREGRQAHPAEEQVEGHLCGHQASVWWRAERPSARTLSVLWKMIAVDEIAASSVFYRRIKSTVKFNCLIYH